MKVKQRTWTIELNADERAELANILMGFTDKCTYQINTTGRFIEELIEELR